MTVPKVPDGRYYAYFALKLAKAGYRIVPIKPKDKRPVAVEWSRTEFLGTEPKFVDNPHGVGIACGIGEHPIAAIDIDVSHSELLRQTLDWCQRNIGCTIERVGAAPRLLLVYRAANPGWRKAFSVSFFDPNDPTKPNGKPNHQRIEVLGRGQQFVAFGIHPDTGRTYQWVDFEGGILGNAAKELPVLRAEQVEELLVAFSQFGRAIPELAVGDEPVSKAIQQRAQNPAGDLDEINEGDVGFVDGVTIDDARAALDMLSPDMTRDGGWIHVGMALHHQFAGDEDALILWDEWSARSATRYPAGGIEELRKQWMTFGNPVRLENAPVTYRTVLRMVADAKRARDEAEREGKMAEILKQVAAASNTNSLMTEVLFFAVQECGTDPVAMQMIRDSISDRYFSVSGGKRLQREFWRDMLEAAKKKLHQGESIIIPKADQEEMWAERSPFWAKGWVFIAADGTFFNKRNRLKATPEAFRFYHNRHLKSMGSKTPDAAAYVRDNALIPVVEMATYWPGKPYVFKHPDGFWLANTYTTHGAAKIPVEFDQDGKWCARKIKEHIELMLTGQRGGWNRECQLFTNYLRHCIEFPGEKITWAVLLQGEEGSGKTLFFHLMQRIMGPRNVGVVTGIQVMRAAETGFTSWAEGQALKFIEEIRLRGHNRYDVVNSLKDKLTNDIVEIVRKGKDPISVPNVMNYVLLTNFKDAVPLDDGSRRYFVLFGRTPLAHLAEHEPDYFKLLFHAISERPGDIAKWILSVPYHRDFKPRGTAPLTAAREKAILLGSDEVITDIRDIIEASTSPAVGPRVVVQGQLDAMLMGLADRDGRAVTPKQSRDALVRLGYEQAGRTRRFGLPQQWVWVRCPDSSLLNQTPEVVIDWAMRLIDERTAVIEQSRALAEIEVDDSDDRPSLLTGEPSRSFQVMPYTGEPAVIEDEDEI